MKGLTIRAETESDHSSVGAIHEAAFGQPQEALLVSALRESASPALSLVADLGGQVVGHVFVSPVTIEGRPPAQPCAGLAPVGVQPAFQRLGVGSALVRAALELCPAVGWPTVFLLGDPNYYSRFGFVLAAPLGFHYESEAFDSAFQLIELEAGALSGASGWVRYHPSFSEL